MTANKPSAAFIGLSAEGRRSLANFTADNRAPCTWLAVRSSFASESSRALRCVGQVQQTRLGAFLADSLSDRPHSGGSASAPGGSMLGFIATGGILGVLAVACAYLASAVQQARNLDAEGEQRWPAQDRSWNDSALKRGRRSF